MKTENCEMGFFPRNPFNKEGRQELINKWKNMNDAEKLDFMNDRMKHFENHNHEDHFSIEAIDKRCEKWMSLSAQEKQEFVDERKKRFEQRSEHFGHFLNRMFK